MLKKLLLILLVASPLLAADTYRLTPESSGIFFSAYHLKDHNVDGRFTRFSGTVVWDEARPENSKISAKIEAASVDTGNRVRDKHLASGFFLDAQNHPYLTFESHRIGRGSDGYVAEGEIQIRGVTQNITIPFQGTKDVFVSRFKIDRHVFGVSYYKQLIKPDIQVILKIKGEKK